MASVGLGEGDAVELQRPGVGAHGAAAGGDGGGEIVALGTPEQVAANKNSFTGKYLKGKL